MQQKERDEIMKKFRTGSSRVLINTDLPNHRENCIHRIGRAGRFGRKRLAINVVIDDDRHLFR